MYIANICQHTFIGDYVNSDSCVIDCGANHGHFSLAVSREFHCNIHGLEPDPRLFGRLPKIDNCKFHNIALFDSGGLMRLNLGNSGCSSLLHREDSIDRFSLVKTVSLPEFCTLNNIQRIDLLKLDVEGAELRILDQLREKYLVEKVSQLTVEFHEHLDPGARAQIKKVIGKLKKCGFYYLPFSLTDHDVLFVNSKYIKLSYFDRLAIAYVKYKRGVGRILKRLRSIF